MSDKQPPTEQEKEDVLREHVKKIQEKEKDPLEQDAEHRPLRIICPVPTAVPIFLSL